MFPLEGIGADVAQFMRGCNRLICALDQKATFSEIEKVMISHYLREVIAKTQELRDEIEKK